MGPTPRRIVATTTAAFVLLALPATAGALTDRRRADMGAAFAAGMQKPNGSIPAFSPVGSTADAPRAADWLDRVAVGQRDLQRNQPPRLVFEGLALGRG